MKSSNILLFPMEGTKWTQSWLWQTKRRFITRNKLHIYPIVMNHQVIQRIVQGQQSEFQQHITLQQRPLTHHHFVPNINIVSDQTSLVTTGNGKSVQSLYYKI